jgi:predicted kinase
VLVGPVASGKSTWAVEHFPPDAVVSSDRLRALVGAGEDDIAASADALALLDEVVARRAARRLTTVVDSTGLDAGRRATWLGLAREHGLACVAVAFDTPAGVCRARERPVPAAVPTAQFRAWPAVRDALAGDGFDEVLAPEPVRVVPQAFVGSAAAADRQREAPVGLRFALHLGEFRGGAAGLRHRLREIAVAAESAGFDTIYVMDHFRQIPQLGRPWETSPSASPPSRGSRPAPSGCGSAPSSRP